LTDIGEALRELLLARAAGKIDAEEFERRQAALHAEVLAGKAAPRLADAWRWALGLVAVVAAIGLAVWIGNSGTTGGSGAPQQMPTPPSAAAVGKAEKAGSGGDLKVMAARLTEKLVKNPTNAEGWVLLGQTYVELRQHKEADHAFSKAAALGPLDPKVLADWADAHVVANDRKWDSVARDAVKRALVADPGNSKALALAGSEAFDRADYKQAIAHWQRMRSVVLADSMDAKLADANIEEAKSLLARAKQ